MRGNMADGIYEVEKVIGRRRTVSGKEEYLVHWKNYNPLYSTWEPVANLTPCLHTVTEFMAKSFPMPGINASCVNHLESSKPERQLKKVTDIDKRKLKGLANKEMVKEILKANNMKKELKYQRGRGRGRVGKRRKLNESSDICGQDAKKFRASPLNGQFTERTLRDGIICHSPGKESSPEKGVSPDKGSSPDKGCSPNKGSPKKRGGRYRGQPKKRSLSEPLNMQFNDSETVDIMTVPRPSTRTTRTHGVLDQCVYVLKEASVWKITLCSEKKKNALTTEMCDQLANILHEASNEEQLVAVVITGAGDSFCAGLDYSILINALHRKQEAKKMVEKFKLLVELLISFPKVLVAVVNGNALGFGTALLALCDVVYANSKATFETCFTKWGHPPIGCSSFLLSRLLGQTGVLSMLLLNRKMAATEAWENGLVMEVLKAGNFMEKVDSRIQAIAAMSSKVLQETKSLIKRRDQDALRETNNEECKLLLKYLGDGQVLDSMKKTWVPEVVAV